MPARARSRLTWISVALTFAAAVSLLAGCATTGIQPASARAGGHVVAKAEVDKSGRPPSTEFGSYPRVTVLAHLRYASANGIPLYLDVCLPATTNATTTGANTSTTVRPAIVSIHGGSWAHGAEDSPHWRNVCQWLASEGYVTASVGYRLAPTNPYPAAIDDIRAAVRWLRAPAQVARYSIDPRLIGAFGGSAGGNLAALLGTAGTGSIHAGARVAAVAELSGPSNLTASGPELPDFEPSVLSYLGCASFSGCRNAAAASPLDQVNSTDPPFFIANSTHERIPLAQSTRLVAKLRAAGVQTTFVAVPGRRHSIAMLDGRMRARVAAFFHATLAATPSPAPGATP